MTGKRLDYQIQNTAPQKLQGYRQQVTDPNHLIAGRIFFRLIFFMFFSAPICCVNTEAYLKSHRIQIRPKNRFETRATCSEPISRQSPVSHVIAWTLTRCSHNLPQLCQSFFYLFHHLCVFSSFPFSSSILACGALLMKRSLLSIPLTRANSFSRRPSSFSRRWISFSISTSSANGI